MNIGDIILCNIRQALKGQHQMILFMKSKKVKCIETESKLVLTRELVVV